MPVLAMWNKKPSKLADRPCRPAFTWAETLTALVVMSAVLGVLTVAITSYAGSMNRVFAQQQALLAAESYLEHLRAGLEPPTEIDGIHLDATRQPGSGPWTGLTQVTVTAKLPNSRRAVGQTLTAYLPKETP